MNKNKIITKDLNAEFKDVMKKIFKENALDKIFTNVTKSKCNNVTCKKVLNN